MPEAIDRLAIFGGRPLFDSPRPIGQLAMPDIEAFLALVKPSFAADELTGNGPIVQRLESSLAAYHGTKHCVTVANAGLGLIMLMQIFSRGRSGNVAMPAFSYRGLPHISRWARQMPRFCDVYPLSHTLDLASVEASIDADTTSILGVCNFNSPGDIAGLCELGERYNVPVFFDSVDALGSTYLGLPLGSNGRAEVFSTHATKMLNGFEGGYITTNDAGLAEILRWQREGARREDRPDAPFEIESIVGLHATFNEIHAGMSLLSLGEIDEVIARNRKRAEAYARGCRGLSGFSLVPYSDAEPERSNYRMVIADIGEGWPLTRDQTVAFLRAEGAAINAYWSPALHRSVHAPPGLIVPALPVAESLAERLLHLPVGELVSIEDIDRLCALLHVVSEYGDAIAARLSELAR